MFSNLTQYEYHALKAEMNLADGHSRQDLDPQFQKIFSNLNQIWREAESTCERKMEIRFRDTYASLIESKLLPKCDNFFISPTASSSIDLVAAFLKEKSATVGLIEPCFDNLALLLKRRGVPLIPVAEQELRDPDQIFKQVNRGVFNYLFIVNPNNPTGFNLSHNELCVIATRCRQEDITIIIDATFRLYGEDPGGAFVDFLIEEKVSFILIEDTGKSFPTLEQKASMVIADDNKITELRGIYEEVFLCMSNFTLLLLINFFELTRSIGLSHYLHQDVSIRRELTKRSLDCTTLITTADEAQNSLLGVEWLDCSRLCLNDIRVTELLGAAGLAVLPGRHFFWSNAELGYQRVRISLMKPMHILSKGLDTLARTLNDDPRT